MNANDRVTVKNNFESAFTFDLQRTESDEIFQSLTSDNRVKL